VVGEGQWGESLGVKPQDLVAAGQAEIEMESGMVLEVEDLRSERMSGNQQGGPCAQLLVRLN
jgi:hypothetical protein